MSPVAAEAASACSALGDVEAGGLAGGFAAVRGGVGGCVTAVPTVGVGRAERLELPQAVRPMKTGNAAKTTKSPLRFTT
jgi:hypothetical protein